MGNFGVGMFGKIGSVLGDAESKKVALNSLSGEERALAEFISKNFGEAGRHGGVVSERDIDGFLCRIGTGSASSKSPDSQKYLWDLGLALQKVVQTKGNKNVVDRNWIGRFLDSLNQPPAPKVDSALKDLKDIFEG